MQTMSKLNYNLIFSELKTSKPLKKILILEKSCVRVFIKIDSTRG